jgi:uncharacterized protein (DUF433 family)
MTLSGFPRIAIDPAVCGGRPVVAGTRMRVTDVLEMLAGGASATEIAADFPYVNENDVRAVLAYAAADHPVVLAAE